MSLSLEVGIISESSWRQPFEIKREVFVGLNKHLLCLLQHTQISSPLAGMAYNFHKYDNSRIDSRGVSYDYDSIMHYSSTAFANRRGVRTIVGKNGRTNLGQRYGLSKKDIQQANLLYCGARPPITKPPPKPQTPPPPGKTDSFSNRYYIRGSQWGYS